MVRYLLHEEGWSRVAEHLRRGPLLSVDHLLKECGNAIWRHAYLCGAIDAGLARKLFRRLLRAVEAGVIMLEHEAAYLDEALRISLEHGIALYDNIYVAQALKAGALLTSDERQAEAAERAGAEVHFIE
ncbi:MAG: PIN domain nuclease [Thermoprotei archaeon]|nr:MAG: PIN domain nuclease [Thermoprotei archaeon]